MIWNCEILAKESHVSLKIKQKESHACMQKWERYKGAGGAILQITGSTQPAVLHRRILWPCELVKGFCNISFLRDHKLALASLGQERTEHWIQDAEVPGDVDENLPGNHFSIIILEEREDLVFWLEATLSSLLGMSLRSWMMELTPPGLKCRSLMPLSRTSTWTLHLRNFLSFSSSPKIPSYISLSLKTP